MGAQPTSLRARSACSASQAPRVMAMVGMVGKPASPTRKIQRDFPARSLSWLAERFAFPVAGAIANISWAKLTGVSLT